MSTFGQSTLLTTGRGIQVTADGRPEAKEIGVTIDWATVAAVTGSAVVLPGGVTIPVGTKYLRYGQVITKITASGKYGPFDSAAVDGRQTLAMGACYILNTYMREDESASDHPEAIYGGLLWRDRILATTGTASLAAGPTFATLLAVLPRVQLALAS